MISQSLKVVVCGASPDHLNLNTLLRKFVASGFRTHLGTENVLETSLEQGSFLIKRFKPSLVLIFGSCMPDSCNYGPIRTAADSVGARVAFWLHDDPYEFDFHYKILPYADFVFSNDRFAALHYDGKAAFHLPLAADPQAHTRPCDTQKMVDLFFCGEAFPNRVRLLRDLAPVLKEYATVVKGSNWPTSEKLPFCKNQRLGNDLNTDYYASSKLVINMGRHFNLANRRYNLTPSTPGPRTFEAGMAGATQLYFVEGLEIEDYYEAGQEILLFDSVEEFRLIVRDMMENPLRRLEIGRSAQQRTLRDHTYAQRAKRVLDLTL